MSHTFELLSDPFRFIGRRAKELNTDVFQLRLMTVPVNCMVGEEAARIFHNPNLFTHHHAAPEFLRTTFLGKGGVQELEGEAHAHRKALLMSVMTPARITGLVDIFHRRLESYSADWEEMETPVKIYDEIKKILFESACEWAGVPFKAQEINIRTNDLASLFEASANLTKNLKARAQRGRADRWIEKMVMEVRNGELTVPKDSILSIFSFHKDLEGNLLTPKIAAVEILNILSPTISVSLFIAKGLHAFHQHPEAQHFVMDGNETKLDHFVQEVRRFYPFFPVLIQKVKQSFTWHGFEFKEGTRTLLDVYGTDHDPRIWEKPDEFLPDRFEGKDKSTFAFIPQGAGNPGETHRCPGIPITIQLMKAGLKFFTQDLTYTMPDQDLTIDFKSPPALIGSGLTIEHVRRAHPYERENLFH